LPPLPALKFWTVEAVNFCSFLMAARSAAELILLAALIQRHTRSDFTRSPVLST
jgi:hypothetical protein